MQLPNKSQVVIAGASGFVGKALASRICDQVRVVGISRQDRPPLSLNDRGGLLHFRQADLFSLKQVEHALEGADTAIYLVHSMMPTNRLTQGSFEDLDVILADNFARAAEKQGVKRIIYVGGLIPDGSLSTHLKSRLEVEWILSSRNIPIISLRAGLVVGANGSSFRIVERLVKRLPVMICPTWTQSLCQPIDIDDLVEVIAHVIPDQDLAPGAYDVGGADHTSYFQMLKMSAEIMKKRRLILAASIFSPRLSRLWLSTITQTPRELVYPLIESLRHDMVARNLDLQSRYQLTPLRTRASLEKALKLTEPKESAPPKVSSNTKLQSKDSVIRRPPRQAAVTSVQRVSLPPGFPADWVAQEYARWVVGYFGRLLRVTADVDMSMRFCLPLLKFFTLKTELLILTYSQERSDPSRALFYVTGGWLCGRSQNLRGRLEFRRLPHADEAVIAVLDFVPRLPWLLYKYTQAQLHLVIMLYFKRHLRTLRQAILRAQAPEPEPSPKLT